MPEWPHPGTEPSIRRAVGDTQMKAPATAA
jgi:hypothetical protein